MRARARARGDQEASHRGGGRRSGEAEGLAAADRAVLAAGERRHGGRRSQDDERKRIMATKTTNIEVKVDETLAAAIAPRIALASRLGLTPSGDTTRRGGQDVACDQLLQREEAGLCHLRGSQDRRGVSLCGFPDGKADLPRWGVGVSLGGGRGFPRWG